MCICVRQSVTHLGVNWLGSDDIGQNLRGKCFWWKSTRTYLRGWDWALLGMQRKREASTEERKFREGTGEI